MMDDCSSDSSAAINLTTTCQASGVTKTGEDVAVKKLKLHCDNLDYKEFQNELNNLRILEHQNIVQFLGYCYEIQQKPYTMPDGSKVFVDDPFIALCFEYMHNGSLQKHLSAEFNGLDWDTRFKIVQGTCEGVRYIHEELQAPIYHLDLKPDNILLDKDMVPKIADFGLSRIFHEEPTRITNRPYGTPGYQPPEYIDRGEISGKFDIFSLGVIIIRIVSGPGSYPKCLYMPSDEFIDQVQKNWRKRLPATSSNDSLLGAYCHQVVTRTQIALNCVDNDSKKRPNIVSITEKLNEIETDIVKNQVEDRISGLPDHILLHILDRLDLPVVIQASTLSRRWKHLPCLLTHLLIDVSHFLPRDKNKRENCTVDQIMTTYTGVVSRLLLLSSSDNRAIERLQLSFYLADPYLRCIGHVVGNVMERGNTKRLEFTIWADVPHPSYERCVLLGQRFMSFLQACPSAFRGLTSLILQNLTFGDSDIPNLLNFCTKLELLSLTYCDSVIDPVTGDDVVLMIDAPQSSLVALEISTCGYAGVHLIQMPKLQRLVCANWIGANPPLRFDNVPCLHSITLRHAALNWQRPFTLSHCLSNTTSLSIIYLNFSDQMIWIEPEDPKHLSPVFGHLRDVYFYNIFYECDLNWTMFVLEAAPSLSNFYLKLSRHPCERSKCEDSAKKVNVPWDQTSPDFKHHWLSLLEIVGFAVDEKLTKYIRLVIELAMGLKRIRLLDQEPCARCDALNDAQTTSPIRWRFPVEEEEKKVIREQLVDGISSPVEISIG